MNSRHEWKNITSYRQGDKEGIPTSWELRLSRDLRICVVRAHPYNPESWVMHCSPWFDTRVLKLPSTVENRGEAMARATALVREKINEISALMQEVN